jgi:hypothetical protein
MKKSQMRRLRSLKAARMVVKQEELADLEGARRRDLVDWLNAPEGGPDRARTTQLIHQIREARDVLPSVSVSLQDPGNPQVREEIKKINERLSRYKMWPRCTETKPAFTKASGSGASENHGKLPIALTVEWWPEGEFETKAAHHVITLEADGQLDSLVQCGVCREWFFAIRHWQKFCPRCRGKQYSTSPHGRAKRAGYMRGYRKRLKRMEEEMKKASLRKKKQ